MLYALGNQTHAGILFPELCVLKKITKSARYTLKEYHPRKDDVSTYIWMSDFNWGPRE